jgi:hypothetical protein
LDRKVFATTPGCTLHVIVETLGSAYGRCGCGTEYVVEMVEVRFTEAGLANVLSDVPRGACPSCGAFVYRAPVMERIEAATNAVRSADG